MTKPLELPDSIKTAAFDLMFNQTSAIHFVKAESDFDFTGVNPAFRKNFGNGLGDYPNPKFLEKDLWLTEELPKWEEHDRHAFKHGYWAGEEKVPTKIGHPVSEDNPLHDYTVVKECIVDEHTGEKYLFCTAWRMDEIEKLMQDNNEEE